MRLLNTETQSLEYFFDPPPYAILSHRWRDEEVTLQDLIRSDVQTMKGYAKLASACSLAHRLGFQYLWMDTCCIDKTSSAELSEAINSMYMWYKKAGMCIAYLDDIEKDGWKVQFRYSVWFTRGWTLQELVAPSEVMFFEKNWKLLGMKTSLASKISEITGVDEEVLLTGHMEDISVAKKMSWAAGRETTKVEDEAYALLGIFDINMPTIYGEGRNAFIRLQEEILKQSDDQSIFAWGERFEARDWQNTTTLSHSSASGEIAYIRPLPNDGDFVTERTTGLLASSPSAFQANDVVQVSHDHMESVFGLPAQTLDAEFYTTNRGIRIRLPLELVNEEEQVYIAYLACADEEGNLIAIFLHLADGNRFSRTATYGEPPLIAIKDDTIIPGTLHSTDWIYVKGDIPRPYATTVVAELHMEGVAEFCKNWGFTVSGYGTLNGWVEDPDPNSISYILDTISDPQMFFLLRNSALQLGFLVSTTINLDRVERADKDLILVDVCPIGSTNDGGLVAYSSNQPINELYEAWQAVRDNTENAGESHSAYVDVNGGKAVFTVICVREPNWSNVDGYNTSDYRMSVYVDPS